jgi:hypothetical protein
MSENNPIPLNFLERPSSKLPGEVAWSPLRQPVLIVHSDHSGHYRLDLVSLFDLLSLFCFVDQAIVRIKYLIASCDRDS